MSCAVIVPAGCLNVCYNSTSIRVYKRGDGWKTIKIRQLRRDVYDKLDVFMNTMELEWDGTLTQILNNVFVNKQTLM